MVPKLQSTSSEWALEWMQLTTNSPENSIQVPPQARRVTTPLILPAWRCCLLAHPEKCMVEFFLQGIEEGFHIGYCPLLAPLKPAKRNMRSALAHEEVVDNYLTKEVQQHRVSGPFPMDAAPGVQISRFGVIPKNHQPHKRRLIVDLPHPKKAIVNDGIPKHLCSMSYVTIDDAIQNIITLGPGTLLAKIDIRSAFRLIPVHPAGRHLLAMKWKGALYIDSCLPFGLRSAPKLFNVLADLLEWILLSQGVPVLMHYLDNYLTMGPPNTEICNQSLQRLIDVCAMLGIPLAAEKVEGPSATIEFLGIQLDTVRMEARLSAEKLARICTVIQDWRLKRNATKREILSLVGLLQHAAKACPPRSDLC